MHLHSLLHTHTSVHTHSHGFPGLERGCFGIWAMQAFWILLIWKALQRLSTRHGEHIPRATLASRCYHTQHTNLHYCSVSISNNPGAFPGHCSPPSFPTKPSFLLSFSGRIERYTMAAVSSLTLLRDFHCFHCFPLPAYLLSVLRHI